MSNRYALFLLGIIISLAAWLRWTGDVHMEYGKGNNVSWETGAAVTGTLLVSPYGVEDDIMLLVSESKYSIDMWMYLLTSKELLQVLKNVAVLGVDIDMVLENKVYGGSSKAFKKVSDMLVPLGVEVVSDDALGTNFVHAKTLLLDERTYIISTANMSYSSFWKNREYWFIGSQPEIAKSLHIIFEKDQTGEKIRYADVHPALLFCPLDCREKIIDALWKATTSIAIEAQYIQDEEVARVLKKKKNEGVDVRIIIGKYQDEGRLEYFGTGVHMMDEWYLHAKNILIDDTVLLMGSMNLSSNALDNNREIGIIVDDPRVTKQFGKQFDRDREKSAVFIYE